MTSNILIGVGGSGQHVVHAYLRLLTLTSPQAGDVPHVILIDADAREGAAERQRSTLVEDICTLHTFLVSGHPNPSRFGLIRPFHTDANGAPPDRLGTLLGIAGDNNPDRGIAHAFLVDDDGEFGSDWEIDVGQGMMSNPKVGAIAFGHRVLMEGEQQPAQDAGSMIRRLINAPLDGAHIAIAGSSFGGTGSGVVPALVRQLDALPGARSIRAFFTLPWFSLDQGDSARRGAAQERDGVDPTRRNASLGLHTYHGELSGAENAKYRLTKSSYVLVQSMPGWAPTVRQNGGDFDQPEHPHVLNLVISCAIQSFFGLGQGDVHPGQLHALKVAGPAERQGRFSPDTSPHLRFRAGEHDNRQLRDLWADAEATALVLDACGRILARAKEGVLSIKDVGDLNGFSGLDQYALQLAALQGSPKAVEYGWLFSRKRRTAPDSVFHELGAALQRTARELRQTLVWLDAHVPPDQAGPNAPGIDNFAPRHLFSVGAPSLLGPTRTEVNSVDDENRLRDPWAALQVQVKGPRGEDLSKAPVSGQAIHILWSVQSDTRARADSTPSPISRLMQDFQSEEINERVKGTPLADLAARVLARAIHKRVRELRGARLRAGERDENQLVADPGPLMLKLNLAGSPIRDSRHAKLRLDDMGLGGGDSDPMDPTHPLSLEFLDPYSGLNQGNGERIAISDHVFVDHGLKGIPNVIAAQLIQQWRLARTSVPAAAKVQGGHLYEVDNGRVRATPAGIRVHARRVIEAAFWLAISANRQVEWVDDIFARPSGRLSPFALLVRGEMGLGSLEAGQGLPALVFSARQGADAGKPVLVWDGETWFLAANRAARTFFARLVPQLPSVRYRYRAGNPLRLAEAPAELQATGLDQYFSRQIRDYVSTLDQRLQQGGPAEPSLRLLRDALHEIAAELPAPARNSAAAGRAIVLPLRGRAIEPSALQVRPPRGLEEVLPFVCNPAVVFVNNNSEPNGMLPIRAEAWDWLEGGTDDNYLVLDGAISRKIDGTKLARARVREIRFKVRDIGEIREEWPFGPEPRPVVADELDWAFGIWPNFEAPDWNYYIVSGAICIGDPDRIEPEDKSHRKRIDVPWMREGMSSEIVVRGRPREGAAGLGVLATIAAGLPMRVDGRPRVFELRVGGQVLGSRPITLSSVRPGDQTLPLVGLDFGTSNTCMAIQTGENDAGSRKSVPLLPGGMLITEPAESLFTGWHWTGDDAEVARFQSEAANFYHAKNLPAEGSAGTMPSELLVMLDDTEDTAALQLEKLGQHYGNTARALLDGPPIAALPTLRYPLVAPLLTPLPPQPSSWRSETGQFYEWMARMVGDDQMRVFGDLKWPREGDGDDYLVSRTLRALYLEAILVAALAALRRRGYVQFKAFVATQPEALAQLENRFADSYGEDLGSVLKKLCQRTGISWSSSLRTPTTGVLSDGELHMVSETTAALQSAGIGPEGRDSVMTIDIGGGTTDVGIDLRYAKRRRGGNVPTRYTASVRFAGNQLLDALVLIGNVRAQFETKQKFTPRALASLLKAELRSARKNGSSHLTKDKAGQLAKVFFDGIYEYAFNALRSFMRLHPDWLADFMAEKSHFRVILIGNGFRLYDACQAAGSNSSLALYNQQIKKRLVDAAVITEEFANRIRFELQDDSKASLIRIGGLDASQAGFTLDRRNIGDRFLLMPDSLKAVDLDGNEQGGIISVSTEQFNEWVDQGFRFVMDHSEGAMRAQFPLTFEHWVKARPPEKLSASLQNIFKAGKNAKYYCDPGAIYLTGLSGISTSESLRTLMVHMAAPSGQ